jgi:PST family polysaccharide transporter
MDTLIVGSVLGMTTLGFYDKAFTTMNRLVVRLAVGQANFRIFSIIQEDNARFRRAYLRLILTVSLIALPAFGAAIAVAPTLFTVLFGKRWVAAALPFQILCVGGVLRLYDGYASHANEALGGIWAQVRRQALGAILVVIGVWTGARFGGVVGAALGVAVAMAVLSATMQTLVSRMTGLPLRAMLGAQIPAAVCTMGVVAVLLGVEALLRREAPGVAAWQLLAVQALAGGAFYAVFLLRSPFASVRGLVHETAHDLGLHRVMQAPRAFAVGLFRR